MEHFQEPIGEPVEVASVAEDAYVAPAIESVVTPDSLEREVLYAGSIGPVLIISRPPA